VLGIVQEVGDIQIRRRKTIGCVAGEKPKKIRGLQWS
jgi:hypothetical protein